MAEEDKSSKTEEPTERRLSQQREKGQVARSREVNNFFMLLGILLAVLATLPQAFHKMMNIMGAMFVEAGRMRDIGGLDLMNLAGTLSLELFLLLIPTMVLLFFLAALATFGQNGFIFSTSPLEPKLEKISLIKGFGRIFSLKSVVEFLKSLFKMIVIGIILSIIVYQHRDDFMLMPDMSIMGFSEQVQLLMVLMILGVLAISFLIAVVDFIYQRFEYRKDNRMSHKDLRDEHKESEGDPYIKQRQRQLRMERARQNMMQEVPKAQVVVTNPTHYAIALRYQNGVDGAPRVLAMGVDHMAMKIRGLAEENNIPMVEDPLLARALYAKASVGDEIPLEMYEAVARVISYIMTLKKNKGAGYVSAMK